MFTPNRITIATQGVRCQETDFPPVEDFRPGGPDKTHPIAAELRQFGKTPTI
jgi:hypothetical protein